MCGSDVFVVVVAFRYETPSRYHGMGQDSALVVAAGRHSSTHAEASSHIRAEAAMHVRGVVGVVVVLLFVL